MTVRSLPLQNGKTLLHTKRDLTCSWNEGTLLYVFYLSMGEAGRSDKAADWSARPETEDVRQGEV